MSESPTGFQAGDLYCFPEGSPDDGSFRYLPGPPGIETVDGDAQINLLNSPAAGVLSLQAIWLVAPEVADRAEEAIRERYPGIEDIDLRIAALSDTTASLRITDAQGHTQTFGPTPTSGPDSYRVVFNETLTSAEKQAALAAFAGQTGVLQLDYQGTLELDEQVKAELSGDLADEVRALAPKKPKSVLGGLFGKTPPPPPAASLDDCLTGVERALGNGKLKLVHSGTPNISASTQKKVDTALRKKAAGLLYEQLQALGYDAISMNRFPVRLKSSEPETVTFQIQRTLDLADWFSRHGGPRRIAEAGMPLSEPDR